MTDSPNVAQEYSQRVVEMLYVAARGMDVPGTAYVVAGDLGEGIIDIKFKFEDERGKKVEKFLHGQPASELMDLVIDWLRALSLSPQRTWKVLLCGVRTTGEFSVVPLYDDDPNIATWDFTAIPPVDLVDLAKPILNI